MCIIVSITKLLFLPHDFMTNKQQEKIWGSVCVWGGGGGGENLFQYYYRGTPVYE